jgi:hypothetical protein
VALAGELVELAREGVVREVREVALGELELSWVLRQELVDTVEEQDEQRGEVLLG